MLGDTRFGGWEARKPDPNAVGKELEACYQAV